MALDMLSEELQISGDFKDWKNLGEYAKVNIFDKEVFLLKPLTYMNKSGEAVISLSRFFKIKPSEIIVICDDISLDLGKIRIRQKGSAGGHNGIKDIIRVLGTQDFPRIKLGVGPQPEKIDSSDFVLSKFKKSEIANLEKILFTTVQSVFEVLKNGLESAMNKFNSCK